MYIYIYMHDMGMCVMYMHTTHVFMLCMCKALCKESICITNYLHLRFNDL